MEPNAPRLLFLNPPHDLPIMRRYMCSYYSPEYLLPPHDLMQLATYVREINQVEVAVLDAVAHRYSEAQVIERIARYGPDMIVALTGIRIFGDDMACLERVKAAFPDVPLAILGFYPTCFPEEVLRNSSVDMVLRREPELPLSQYLDALRQGRPVDAIAGLAGRRVDGSLFINKDQRVQSLNAIPFPDPDLVDIARYEEAFLGGPCGAILSARGCRFSCTYCTTTYGRTMVMKSPETVVAEMRYLVQKGARIIRFLDDTFTFDRQRVLDICRLLIEQEQHIPWTCLARVDTVDAEMLDWMRRAGCKRIMVGVESYSANVLNILNKGIDPSTINPQLALIRKAGIEALGFFMVGAPFETEADFQETVRGALASPLNFLIINTVDPYAGTPYFNQFADQIEFSLLPYKCEYKDPEVQRVGRERYRRLYRRFYLRPIIFWRQFFAFLRHPLRSIQLLIMFGR